MRLRGEHREGGDAVEDPAGSRAGSGARHCRRGSREAGELAGWCSMSVHMKVSFDLQSTCKASGSNSPTCPKVPIINLCKISSLIGSNRGES